MAQPQWSPVDNTTASLLDLIQSDWRPFAQDDMNTIAAAIKLDAETHDGEIHPNRVRRDLAGKVKPQRVGITYRAMCLAGLIEVDGWDVNDGTGVDRENSGNSGKPQRTYRWRVLDNDFAWTEHAMSDCPSGCKVYRHRDGLAPDRVIHNSNYGCRRTA